MKSIREVPVMPAMAALIIALFMSWGGLIGLAQPPQPATGVPAAAPAAPLTLDDAMFVLVLPNVLGLDERLNAVTAKFTTDKNAPSIRKALGDLMKDESLVGMSGNAGIVIVGFSFDTPPIGFFEVSAAKAKDYLAALQMAHKGAEMSDGLLIMASAKDAATSRRIAAQIKSQYLGTNRDPNVQATLFVKRILARYDPQLQLMLTSLPAMMGLGMSMQQPQPQGGAPAFKPNPAAIQQLTRVLEAELRIFYSLAKQTDIFKMSIDFNQGDIQFNTETQPLPGSNLAAFAAAPMKPAQDLLKMLPGAGSIRGAMAMNAEAYGDLVMKEGNAVCDQMKIAQPDRDAIMGLVKDSLVAIGDGYAFEMAPTSQAFYNGAMVARMKDAAGSLKFMETLDQKWKSSGMSGMYESLGMPMKFAFTKNARDYKGTPIHVLAMDMEFKSMPPAQAEQMKKLMGDLKYSIAYVGNIMVLAMGVQAIEPVIDSVKAGSNLAAKPLIAETAFGAGQQIYFDLGLGAVSDLMTMSVAQTLGPGQPNPFKDLGDALKASEPLIVAGAFNKTAISGKMRVPASLVTQIGKAAQTLMAAARAPRAISPEDARSGGKPAKSAPPAGF